MESDKRLGVFWKKEFSPCIDEVLGQADVGGGPCDGDLALRWPFHGVSNFDLRPRHLTDLVDFGSLASDYAAY